MFIEYLNQDEKEVFFSLALDLVKVDDAFSEEEKSKINSLSLNILGDEGYEVKNLKSDISTFENLSKKKIVLIELVSLSYIDGDYCDSEKRFIRDLAEKLEVSGQALSEIEGWALGLVDHISKGIEIINK